MLYNSESLNFVAPADGEAIVDTLGSLLDTILWVYRDGLDFQKRVACDDNGAPDGLRSRVRFPITNGILYVLLAASAIRETGPIPLNLRWGVSPRITQPPVPQIVRQGDTVQFTVQASGEPTPTYQWFFGTARVPDATNASLFLTNVQPAQAGSYHVQVANFLATNVSETVTLIVRDPVRLVLVSPLPPAGVMRFQVTGLLSRGQLHILSSTNLTNWSTIHTTNVTSSMVEYSDAMTSPPGRFYRALLQE